MALEAGLPCGKAENSLRSNSRPCLSQGRPASTLRDGNFSNGRRDENKEDTATLFSSPLRSSFFRPFLKKGAPQDGKRSAYVKKSICLSEASFMDFSKLTAFQAFLQDQA